MEEKQKNGEKSGKVGKYNPPKEYQFTSENQPKNRGRKKNSPNRSTFIKKILESKVVPPQRILGNLKAMYPQYFERKGQAFETRLVLVIRLIQEAIIKGDEKKAKLLLDYAYGKEPDKIEGNVEDKKLTLLLRKVLSKKEK